MNIRSSSFVLLISMLLGSMVSCENKEVSEPEIGPYVGPEVTSISEQIAFVEASIEDLNALIDAVDAENPALEDAVGAMQSHVEYLSSGVSLKDAGLAAISLQECVAVAVASVGADQDIKADLDKIETSVKTWLGSDLYAVYPLAYAQARIDCLLADMNESKLYIDGIASDIEAGLRDEISADEIGSLDGEMAAQVKEAMEMVSSLSDLATEVRSEYEQVFSFAVSGDDDYEIANLNSLNKSVELALQSVDESFSGLSDRVAQCEAKLAELLERISDLEEEVGELLDMIQSLTFVSKLSDESVLAFYNMDLSSRYADGKAKRLPAGNIELNYLVRPAAAAKVFEDESLMNDGVGIIGYYASTITTKTVSEFIDFEILAVEADPVSGLVTLQVSNELSEDFYMARCGAKMALSVTSGKTDLTSKFVEIVPKDASGNIYIKELELSATKLEIPSGESVTLKASVLPADAYETSVTYQTSDFEVVQVTSEGKLTAGKLGTAVVTVTTDGTDEWGQTLQARCSVTVVPNMKISGPIYVEEGQTVELEIESTSYVDPDDVVWASSNRTYATVEGNVVTGVSRYYDIGTKEYKPIDITATIGTVNPIVLTHQIRVVAKQPKAVAINNLANDATSFTMKLGAAYSLASTILPAEVSTDLFRVVYFSQNTGVFTVGYDDGYVSAKSIGSAAAEIRVLADGQFDYYFPKGNDVRRYVTVNVEPYYVEKVVLPSSMTMAPDQVATLTPEFVSDVADHLPTYTDLAWTSSRPDIVSVDPVTGEMTAKAEGTSVITAVTSHSMAVPSGSSQKSAQCIVTVEKPSVPINVGDYYYSDGTWSTNLDASKSVVGVVFAIANAAVADSELFADYPGCTHGLVVATQEYSYTFGYISTGYTSTGKWFIERGYTNNNTTVANGYSNTKALQAYDLEKDNGQQTSMAVARKGSGAPDKHAASVTPPASASMWYVPSYYEMSLLYDNKAQVNAALSAMGATQVSDAGYWSSSLQWTSDNYKDILYLYTFDMSTGGWGSSSTAYTVSCPVRVVLAF